MKPHPPFRLPPCDTSRKVFHNVARTPTKPPETPHRTGWTRLSCGGLSRCFSTRFPTPPPCNPINPHPRSEAHTSELHSLMRTSYAVSCLKQNQPTPHNATHKS